MDEAIPTSPAAQRRRSRTRRTLVMGALLLTVVAGAAGGLVGASLERTGGVEAVHLPQPAPAPGPPPGLSSGPPSGVGGRATGTGLVLDTCGRVRVDGVHRLTPLPPGPSDRN
ncbi:hypothetical protein ACFV23_41430 [Streptomyces sp. NPDC059627]